MLVRIIHILLLLGFFSPLLTFGFDRVPSADFPRECVAPFIQLGRTQDVVGNPTQRSSTLHEVLALGNKQGFVKILDSKNLSTREHLWLLSETKNPIFRLQLLWFHLEGVFDTSEMLRTEALEVLKTRPDTEDRELSQTLPLIALQRVGQIEDTRALYDLRPYCNIGTQHVIDITVEKIRARWQSREPDFERHIYPLSQLMKQFRAKFNTSSPTGFPPLADVLMGFYLPRARFFLSDTEYLLEMTHKKCPDFAVRLVEYRKHDPPEGMRDYLLEYVRKSFMAEHKNFVDLPGSYDIVEMLPEGHLEFLSRFGTTEDLSYLKDLRRHSGLRQTNNPIAETIRFITEREE